MGTAIKESSEGLAGTAAENWSLLMDGEMGEQELDVLLAQCAKDSGFAEQWHTYHVIGDVLRSSDFAQAHVNLSCGHFMEEFRQRLAKEPVIVAPVALPRSGSKKAINSQHWSHLAGWLAASGFVVMAVVGIVYSTQNDQISVEQPVTVVAVAPSATQQFAPLEVSGQSGIAAENIQTVAAPAAMVAAANSRSRSSSGSEVPIGESIVALASPAADSDLLRGVQVKPQAAGIAQQEERLRMLSSAISDSNIQLVETSHGRVWRDQRLEPYIFAHQQFRSGVSLDVPFDGYMLSSAVSSSTEH